MKAYKIILLITAGTIASTASARDRKLDIDVQIKNSAPQLAASMDQSHYLIRNRQYGLAVDVLRKIIRAEPKNASAYSAIAVAYDGLGRPDLARKNFEMALAYAPLEERHYRNLARHLNASGEMALARNIMKDFEIARDQKARVNVKAIPEPALDITALLTRLDRESVPVAANFPSELPDAPLPDAPENGSAAITVADIRIASKAARTSEPVATGKDEPMGGGSGATTIGADTNHSIALTTIDDVDDSIAEIYKGLGVVTADPQPDQLFSGSAMAETQSQSSKDPTVNRQMRDIGSTAVQLAADMDSWLNDLSKRHADIAYNSQMVENHRSSKTKARAAHLKTGNFKLVRQSLGEVLLTSSDTDWLASKPARTAGVTFDSLPQQMKIETGPADASHYFAAIRSVFDSDRNRIAIASADILGDLALKQLDMAMAELAEKRHSRLPRIDQGPSQQLQKIAATLYREAEAARTIPLQPAKQSVRVALFYRTETACAV
ncbi:hypothetical protein [Tritonibacter scottomollicae]|uniref:tetratricopeptide repeat protein n=1 Tax=Tritonibacter scottomollicae TaxID=483013 RepID=UPI003AA88B8F